MLFGPITARSFRARLTYGVIYLALALGAVTMITPFLIMISGSVDPRANSGGMTFFPDYLFNDDVLWERYVEIKYHGLVDNLRMAWGSPGATFDELPVEKVAEGGVDPALWREFVAKSALDEKLLVLGFLRPNAQMPAFSAFQFRNWLRSNDGTLKSINRRLDSSVTRLSQIQPPRLRMDGAPLPHTPLVRSFLEFSATVPLDRKFAWDVGGYYRTSILPRLVGYDVNAFNRKFGTAYASYAEVPFTATVPEIAPEPWFFFVTRLLRNDFVDLTPVGRVRMAELGQTREEFIRTNARPDDLRVVSADRLFAEWAARRGVPDARIPQQALDREVFAKEKDFWRWQFLTLNYRTVLDEIMGQGGAIRNTLILVVLSVAGALLINPLAAYALSRYKMKTSYYILLFCLATIAFPAEVTMIPVFLQLKEFHLLNTFGALVLPGLANGFSIFLLKGFFDSLPRELYEAAELDGASEWTTFWNITMYLSKPILAVIALHAFVTAYGTFFFALILAPDPKMWTIMVYIYQLRQSVATPVVYASLIITAIPTLLVFVTCQNIILRGIVVPSEK